MAKGTKAYFQFNKGINTEASPAAWPEGYSIDEENYDLLIDGTRRKRRGLTHTANQTVGSGASLLPTNAPVATATFYWNSVGGDSTKNFIVQQRGPLLYVYPNDTLLIYTEVSSGTGTLIDIIDITPFAVPGTSTTQLAQDFVSMAFGRGNAVLVSPYINPLLVKYVGGTNPFTISTISIVERDFKGQPDGLLVDESSSSTNLTVQQSYNLQNRGWSTADMKTYNTSQGKWPAKNMIPWLGYRGKTTTGVAEADWTKEFSPDKLIAELFQNVSAPQGHLLMSPLVNAAPPGTSIAPAILTWSMAPAAVNGISGTVVVSISTVTAHGLANGTTFHWNGASKYRLQGTPGGAGEPPIQGHEVTISWEGDYQVQATPSSTIIQFQMNLPASFSDFGTWTNQYYQLGSLTYSTVTNITNLNYTNARPSVASFWGGRAIYTGINDGLFSSKIYFSQILEDDTQYGSCYQVADPTDQRISDIVDSDGGVLYIPEMATALHTEKVGSFLMIFASNGVWSIGPGQSGFFSPTSYSVRKVSDNGVKGKRAVTLCEHLPYFASDHDVFAVQQDPQTGQLNAHNVTASSVHTLYSNIVDKSLIKLIYDDMRHRLLLMYRDPVLGRFVYNRLMIFDLRLNAVTKYAFGTGTATSVSVPMDISVIKESPTTTDDNKLLYSCFQDTTTTSPVVFFSRMIRDAAAGGYLDNGVTYNTYLATAYDTVDNPVSRKQAPYIYVYSNRTETGFIDTGTDLLPIEPSSTLMSAQWDFTNNRIAGKITTPQQVYRHKMIYTSDALDFEDGRPMVITKNLIRGAGKVLTLNFYNNDPASASWLVGWQTNFTVGGEAP